ncbi:MAG: hypothetical protein U9Q90_03585 [Campylobacterota bacterium]|nr:hypothetical protein [Campylobacterota bacterium]
MKIEVSEIIYNVSMILLVLVVSLVVTKLVGKLTKSEEEESE